MPAAKGAAPDGNPGAVDVATIFHPSDGGIPVGELSLDRQQLPRLAAAVSEVPVGEGQGGDAGLREPLGEGVQAHLACRAEAVPEDDHGRRGDSCGQVKPCGTGVLAGGERDVVPGERLRSAHYRLTAPLVELIRGHPARFERLRVGVRAVEGQLAGGVRIRKVLEHQFLTVLGLIGLKKLGALDVEAFRQRHRAAEVHRPLDGFDRPFGPLSEVVGEFDRPRDDLVGRHDVVNRPIGQRLRGRERLALEDRNQRLVGADEPGQSLAAATARHDPEEDFRLADEELPIGHDAQIAGPGEFRAQTQRRTVQGGNEDHAAGVHAQERRVQAIELGGSPKRGPAQNGLGDAGAVYASGQAQNGRCAASVQVRDRGTLCLQPPHVGMTDEPAGTRAGEHDGVDVWITVDAAHQLVELVGGVHAEQAVRAAVDPHDQGGSAVLDLEVGLSLCVMAAHFRGV